MAFCFRLTVTLYDEEGQIIHGQVDDVSSVDKICPLPVLSTHQKVYVSHACPEGIYLQKAAFADLLADLLQRLYEFYNETESVEHEWKTTDFCCAKSVNDEQWYRAQIVNFVDEEINVQYVDYGNSETLPVSNLRKLDSSFYTPHALSLKVYLHVTWTVPEDNLLELAGDTEYNAVVLRGNDGWVVELLDGSGQSITDKLVELGFATALENSPFMRVVEGGRFVEGSNINISVSFIDSPLQLWIFVGNDIEQIEALQDRLQEAAPKLLQLKEPTGIFAAKFSDDLWYRANLLENSTVRFIDYGNSDTVNLSDIKVLSADFLEPAEGFAVKVELPVGNFKPAATERLNELLISSEIESEEEIIAHILSVNDSFIVADILKGGKSVVDILVEESLVTRVEKVCSGFISHFNSLNDFFVQESSVVDSLESISTAMLTADSFEHLAHVNEEDIVAALYSEDGLWYRAKVTKNADHEVVVLFIDYGNTAIATDFRSLPSDLKEKPPLSRHCALQLPNGVNEWTESANEKFVELSADGSTQFDIKILNKEDIATVMLSFNGKCVTEELKPYCEQLNVKPSLETSPIDLTGYNMNVYICHVNSPTDFYVQVEGAEVELDAIREELADPSVFEKLEEMRNDLKGKTIGALFVDDELWYRAKVINITEEGSEVLLVDYGNTATATQFVKLPDNLESKEPVAMHCSLGMKNSSEESCGYFTDLSGDGTVPFSMKIVEEGDPKIVSLILDDKVIENELSVRFSELASDIEIEKENLTENDKDNSEEIECTNDSIIKTVFLIQVNSPSDFFLHTAEATQQLEEISERLTTAADFDPVDKASLSKGSILAGQIDDDDLWYRAKVIDLGENEIKVLFIDYGNTATVAKVHSLPDDILAKPPLAMRCALEKPEGNEWSLKGCEIFNHLANDDNLSFDLKILTEGDPNVVELFADGESVTEQLKAVSGLATDENSAVENLIAAEPSLNNDNDNEEKLLDPESLICDVQKDNLSSPVKDFSSDQTKDEAEYSLNANSYERKVPADSASVTELDENLCNSLEIPPKNDLMSGELLSETIAAHHIAEKNSIEMIDLILESVDKKVEDNLYSEIQQITDNLIVNATSSSKKVIFPKKSKLDVNGKLESDEDEDYDTPDEEKGSPSEKTNSEFASPISSENGHGIESQTSEVSLEENKTDFDISEKQFDEIPVSPPITSNTPDKENLSSHENAGSECNSPKSSENGHEVECKKSEVSVEENKTNLDFPGKLVSEIPVTPSSRSNISEKLVPGCISSIQLDDS